MYLYYVVYIYKVFQFCVIKTMEIAKESTVDVTQNFESVYIYICAGSFENFT